MYIQQRTKGVLLKMLPLLYTCTLCTNCSARNSDTRTHNIYIENLYNLMLLVKHDTKCQGHVYSTATPCLIGQARRTCSNQRNPVVFIPTFLHMSFCQLTPGGLGIVGFAVQRADTVHQGLDQQLQVSS